MEGENVTTQLAQYVLQGISDKVQPADLEMAKLAFLDWVGAAVSGKEETCVQKLLVMDQAEKVQGDCTVIAQSHHTSGLNAALLNGTESHALDFDDIHDYLSLHLCSPVFPAAVAAGEMVQASGLEFMKAVMAGMQVMVSLAAGIMPEHYNLGRWHATSTLGIFGAVAAAGKLLKISVPQMCNAFGICANLASGIQLNFGTMAKPMVVGMAAKNGVMAAMLAKEGFTGKADIFDTEYLLHISLKKDLPSVQKSILERLRGSSAIQELRFKRYPCGAPTHSGIINCRKILEKHPFSLDDIQKIVFEPYPRAIRLVGITHPKTGLEGKFSIFFTAAAQIVFGKVTMETFTDEAVKDPRVRALLDKMEMVPNDEFTYSRGGKATIYLKNGEKYSHATYLLGHPLDLAEAKQEVLGKFHEILEPRMPAGTEEQILSKTKQLKELSDIRELTRSL